MSLTASPSWAPSRPVAQGLPVAPVRPASPNPAEVVESPTTPDLEAAAGAAAAFLTALGVSLEAGSRAASPMRMARAWAEMLTPRPFSLTTFPNDGYQELVLAREIPVQSVCEHHLLPFTGVAHIGYLPGGRIVGLSKLARVVEHFARRPQVQERLTRQIADYLQEHLDPRGVGVVIEARHQCMSLRGVRADAATVTSTFLGEMPERRAEMLGLVGAAARGTGGQP